MRKLNARRDAQTRKGFSERIKLLMKNAASALHVTNVDLTKNTNRRHRAPVCLVCDCFITGAHVDGLPSMSRGEILRCKDRLSVQRYERDYRIRLKPSLQRDYEVPGFDGMLLSKRGIQTSPGRYAVCMSCKKSLNNKKNNAGPPKYAIANGNAIGTFPTCIPCRQPGYEHTTREIDLERDINPVMKAFMAPIRPFGYILQHSGGRQKCISGHYQFFETDQTCVTGALNFMESNITNNVFVMICGATTKRQRETITNRTAVNVQLYKDIRSWFIENSACESFRDQPMPHDVDELRPTYIRDSQNANDEEADPAKETTFGETTYCFSSAQDPQEKSSVYGSSKKFACALIKKSSPTLLLHGGNYAREHKMEIEGVLPFAFPYGIGGPNNKRKTPISKKQLIQRYLRLAMPQFMTPEVILVLHHMYSRQLSYESGVMTCRNKHNDSNFISTIRTLRARDFEEREGNRNPQRNPRVESVIKSITTSCKSMAHTAEAAADARKKQFAMMDHFGLNSIFLTITPDDECSFRVRLYAEPDEEVCSIYHCPNMHLRKVFTAVLITNP